MSDLFFYGTLRHVPLLETVLGRDASDLSLAHADLPGYAVCAVKEGPFPTIVPRHGETAQGVLVKGLQAQDIARLNYYEGGFDYDLVKVTLADGHEAQVYMPPPDVWTAMEPWDLAEWESHWAALSVEAAQEVMGHLGTLSRAQVAEKFGMIRTRAWGRVLARSPRTSQGVFDGRIELAEARRAYTGYFAVDELVMRHELFGGGMSDALDRSVFLASDVAIVLPYDPNRDAVLLVEQVRLGPIGRKDPTVWQLEPIAGRIDPGEQPEAAARREASEEAGLDLHRLELVSESYPTPGTSTEFYHIFVGLTDLPDSAAGLGGLETEAEDIRARIVGFDTFLQMAETRALANTPLHMLAYWLAHHRKRLRSG
ncbi:NUDIX domain-containing protein [Sulfitobacter sp. S190]|uniref:NUDIX domain-containing protein n=1 Tax=Sulfitobacter sp. S190 TaxID=2867022 RepID=UPI0021A561E2|nr:NUDIX domain-containing protein [Sulfitobacter sp. S190]UWR23897.1 NUDIX domain-containing protein [Sulfitobacter sp. S190]